MKGLLIKDFRLLKTRGIFLLLVVAGYTVFQLGTGSGEAGVGFATLMTGFFSLTTITYDEYENGMPFLFTLPIQRKEYVREKYLFALLVATITWIIMSVICFGFELFIWKETQEILLDKIVFCVGYLVTVYFLLAVQIAVKLRFSERSSIFMIVIVAIMGAFAALFYIDVNVDLNLGRVAVVTLAVAALLIFACYKWAVRTVEKREF